MDSKATLSSLNLRWQQRFQNFDRAFVLLRSVLEEKRVNELNRLEQEGLIQRFEYTYELAWKTAKDYLQAPGVVFEEMTPLSVIKAAFTSGLIQDGQVWVEMRLHRNMLSHCYDEQQFLEVLCALEDKYLSALDKLHLWFLNRMASAR